MLHLIKEFYRNPDEKNINVPIINRTYEKDLTEYITACFNSISRVLTEIKLVDSNFIIDVDKVNQGSYERTRSNKIKDKAKQFCYIQESRLGELVMTFHVDMNFEGNHTPLEYHVKLLIPIPDAKGYYLIKGNRYILQYQLTESSTYTTSNAVVEKSLLPIKVRKDKTIAKPIPKNNELPETDMEMVQDTISAPATNGNEIILNMHKVLIFHKYENYMYFYLATMGWSNALEYFNVGEYIKALPAEDNDPSCTYFKISSSLFLKVKTRALKNDYIQSVLGNIIDLCSNRLTYDDLENKRMWVSKIGAFKANSNKESHYELGKRYIILFNRMLDDGTIDSLRLTDYNRRDVYAIIRWMVQNYKILWQKDNLNIVNKRLRCNEYVASLLNDIISERIKKFVNTTANTEEKLQTKYNNFFSYRGNEIISKLHSSGLMRYDDVVNDADLWQRLKVTSKGPNASGNKSDSKTVSARRRGLDPSHIGKLDINFCSSSDPGLTNYLTLGCKTDGLYFKDAPPEPETFYYDLQKDLGRLNDDGCPVVIIDPVKYNLVLDAISECHIKKFVNDPEDIA